MTYRNCKCSQYSSKPKIWLNLKFHLLGPWTLDTQLDKLFWCIGSIFDNYSKIIRIRSWIWKSESGSKSQKIIHFLRNDRFFCNDTPNDTPFGHWLEESKLTYPVSSRIWHTYIRTWFSSYSFSLKNYPQLISLIRNNQVYLANRKFLHYRNTQTTYAHVSISILWSHW